MANKWKDRLLIALFAGLVLYMTTWPAWSAIYNWGYGDLSGTSLDTKPTGTIKAGARFFETDTKKVWIMPTTGGTWTTITDETGGGGGTLDDLTDVSTPTPSTGDILQYTGAGWENVSTSAVMTANSGTAVYGTVSSGTYTYTWAHDISKWIIDEVVGANALEVTMEFTVSQVPNMIVVHGHYNGAVSTDEVGIQLWNVTNGVWDTLDFMASRTVDVTYQLPIFDAGEYTSPSNTIGVRFYHPDTGKSGHHLDLDYVTLVKSIAGGGGITNHSALSGLTNQDHPATAVTYSAYSTISGTSVQLAIQELTDEKAEDSTLSSHTSATTTAHSMSTHFTTTTSFVEHTGNTTTAHGGPYSSTSHAHTTHVTSAGSVTSGALAVYSGTSGTLITHQTGTGHVKLQNGVVTLETMTSASTLTCTGTDKFYAYNAASGTFTCATDQTSGSLLTSKLTATYTNGNTTGTEVTGLQIALSSSTTYRFSCFLLARNATVANGIDIGINYTGTNSAFVVRMNWSDTGTTASNGTADDVISGDGSETIQAQCNNTALSTTSPNLNCLTAFTTITADHLLVVEGVLVTGTAGDFEVWAASESTTNATLSIGSNCMAQAM